MTSSSRSMGSRYSSIARRWSRSTARGVDYVRQGLNESFRFDNPKVRGECGCGESFTV